MKSGGKTFDNLSGSLLSVGMLLAIAIFPMLVQADDWPQSCSRPSIPIRPVVLEHR